MYLISLFSLKYSEIFLNIKYILSSIVYFDSTNATAVICGSEDDIVDIDEDHQDHILLEKELECLTRISIEKQIPNG